MNNYEVRLMPSWDRSEAIINPSNQEIENVFNDPSIGRSCLGQLTAGCYKQVDGKNVFKDSISLDFYIGNDERVVISRDYNLFAYTKIPPSGRFPLPIESGEDSLIESRFFIPIASAIDLVRKLVAEGFQADLGSNWDDPLIHENSIHAS